MPGNEQGEPRGGDLDDNVVVLPTGAEVQIDPEAEAERIRIRAELHQTVLGARSEQLQEQRLLSINGILAIVSELGVPFEGDSLNEGNVNAFLERCLESLGRENYVVVTAMAYVVYGQLALNAGNPPQHVSNEHENPISVYLGALQLIDNWLDARRKESELPEEAIIAFHKKKWNGDWKKACGAAAAVEKGVIKALTNEETGQEVSLGQETPTRIHLYDSDARPIGAFTTFSTGTATLAQDLALAERPVEGVSTNIWKRAAKDIRRLFHTDETTEVESPDDQFRAKLFPESEYPDSTVVDQARVEHVMGVTPLPPHKDEILFRLGFDGGERPYEVEVITGEDWHTSHKSLFNPEGGRGTIGVPSSVGGGNEEFFVARTTESLGAKRAQRAEEVGRQASTSVVLVIKPSVDAVKARFRKDVIKFRKGELTANQLAKIILDNPGVDNLLSLREQGWLDGEQLEQVNSALSSERASRKALEDIRKAQEAQIFTFAPRGDDLGDDRMKGGRSASFTPLHTGASGVGTGAKYGFMTKTLLPDPFASPRIIVLQPVGVHSADDTDETIEQISQVVDLGKRR